MEEGYTIECGDVAAVLRRAPRDRQFDLVLLDPPYDADPGSVMQALEAAAGLMNGDGLLVLERSRRRDAEVPALLLRVRDVVSGDSALTLMRMRR